MLGNLSSPHRGVGSARRAFSSNPDGAELHTLWKHTALGMRRDKVANSLRRLAQEISGDIDDDELCWLQALAEVSDSQERNSRLIQRITNLNLEVEKLRHVRATSAKTVPELNPMRVQRLREMRQQLRAQVGRRCEQQVRRREKDRALGELRPYVIPLQSLP